MLDDLKFACRRLRSSPGFTFAATLTLAAGVGTTAAILSIADAVLFRPLPYRNAGELFVLRTFNPTTAAREPGVSYELIQLIDRHHTRLGRVALRGPPTMMIQPGGTESEWIETMAVAPDYFAVLGVQPARGRFFRPDDAETPGRVVVLSHESWQQRFAGDEQIIGKSIHLGASSREVIGVLPAGFIFPSTTLRFLYSFTNRPEFISAAPPPGHGAISPLVSGGNAIDAIVRLERGVTREQAQAELDAIALSVQRSSDVQPRRPILEEPRALLFPTGRPILAFLLGGALFVLLIGAANLTGLFLTRTQNREREIGIRAVLGATRIRILRPMLFEGMMIGLAGSFGAVLTTAAAFSAVVRYVPATVYGNVTVGVDVRVALIAFVLGVGAGLLCTLVPAWRTAELFGRVSIRNQVPRPPGRFGRRMIAFQVALATVLLSGAVVASRALVSALSLPLGFNPHDVIALNARLPRNTDGLAVRALYVQAIETLAARADVLSAGAGGSTPLDGFRSDEQITRPVNNGPGAIHVLPGYFETLEIALRRGRLLTWDDVQTGEPVAVVSEAAGRALVGDGDPVGASFTTDSGRRYTIVGVVANVLTSFDRELPPSAYVLPAQATRRLTILVRVKGRDANTLVDIRRQLAALTPGEPVAATWWTDSIESLPGYRIPRFQTLVLVSFAGLAMALTALGIFAVVKFLVATRTREMGIRLALGASRSSLIRLIVRHAGRPIILGVAAGGVAAYWLRHVAESQLHGVHARDPLPVLVAVTTVSVAAWLAAYLPAREATRVDPQIVLRAE